MTIDESTLTTGTRWSFAWRPSRYLLVLRVAVLVATVAALSMSAPPLGSAWLVVSMSLLLLLHIIHSHRVQPVQLTVEDGNLTIELLNGRRVAVRARAVYCISWLQVLRLRCWRGRAYTLLVLPDSGDRQQRHLWRYFLRHEFPYGSASAV